jgi:hypothetical protein
VVRLFGFKTFTLHAPRRWSKGQGYVLPAGLLSGDRLPTAALDGQEVGDFDPARGGGFCPANGADVTAYNNSDDSKLPDLRTAEARNIFNQLTNLASDRDTAKAKLDDLNQRINTNNAAIKTLEGEPNYTASLTATEATITPDQKKARDDHAVLLKLQGQYKNDKAPQAYQDAQDSLATYIKDDKVKNLAANLKLIASIDAKQDAYSVFGSFDGSAGANGHVDSNGKPTGEATLVVGKVFSTGVASQFLTQGLKALYAGKGNSACITQVASLRQDFALNLDPNNAGDKKKIADFSAKLVAMCTPPAS